jgi:ABC-type dipeptide/oligopeptide/nickel transport system ATPase component
MIASAFIIDPKLLIADEPTTALDVTVQAQIIELLRRISRARGVGILFISHDLRIVRKLCTRVAVMYEGKIVETDRRRKSFLHPQAEYTKRLIAAIPGRRRRED